MEDVLGTAFDSGVKSAMYSVRTLLTRKTKLDLTARKLSLVGRNVLVGSEKRLATQPLRLRCVPGAQLRPAKILYMCSRDP